MTQNPAAPAVALIRPWTGDENATFDLVRGIQLWKRHGRTDDDLPTHAGDGRELVASTSCPSDVVYRTSTAYIGAPDVVRAMRLVEDGQRIACPLRELGRADLRAVARAARLRLFGTVLVTDEEHVRLPLSLEDMRAILGDPLRYDPWTFETLYEPKPELYGATARLLGFPVITDPRALRHVVTVLS